MKKLVIDVGNVICKVDPEPFILKLAEIAHISEEEVWKFFRLGMAEHDLGHISLRDQMIRDFRVSEVAADFLIDKFWNAILTVDEEMMNALVGMLREGGQIGILSNMGKEHFCLMREKLAPLFQFSGQVFPHFSCEVGARKPSKIFFQSFLTDHENFRYCLYVDDLWENIEGGKKSGFEGFQFSLLDADKSEKIRRIFERVEQKRDFI